MINELGSLIAALKGCVEELDTERLSGDEAMALCARFAEVERLGAAGRVVTAARVSATEEWRRGGWRSAADWVGRQAGVDPERIKESLETEARLAEFRIVAAGLRAGRLSEGQAGVIVNALSVRPELEEHLVEFAAGNSLRRLREECRRVKTASTSAAEECAEVYRSRSLKTWTGRDGAFCFSGRATAPAGAKFLARIEERKARRLEAARKDGRREPFPALALDALLELVTEERGGDGAGRSAPTRPKTMTIVHVAYEALLRGALADGEVCEIRGIGPIPIEVARRLAADSTLRVLVTKGAQPMCVTPGVRTIPRALRLLIEARDRTCVIKGCDVSLGLEIDHLVDFALGGPTDLDHCGRLCGTHHDMKTYLGFRRVRDADGDWILVPPDDYRDPDPPDPLTGATLFRNPWTGRLDEEPTPRGVGTDEAGNGAGGRRVRAGPQLAVAGVAGGPAP